MVSDFFVRRPIEGGCWICKSALDPSREHKFKASDIRRHFRNGAMMIGSSGTNDLKLAQGPNSDRFKFKSTICIQCNSHVTQESDRAYDELIVFLERNGCSEKDIENSLSSPIFQKDSKLYIPLFRYFAKILGCHLAEIESPVPIRLANFVAKKTGQNCIWLKVQPDETYKFIAAALPPDISQYIAHGGLGVLTSKKTLLPKSIISTLTIGPFQFTFYFDLSYWEVLEMRLRYPKFIQMCAKKSQEALADPTSISRSWRRLGMTTTADGNK